MLIAKLNGLEKIFICFHYLPVFRCLLVFYHWSIQGLMLMGEVALNKLPFHIYNTQLVYRKWPERSWEVEMPAHVNHHFGYPQFRTIAFCWVNISGLATTGVKRAKSRKTVPVPFKENSQKQQYLEPCLTRKLLAQEAPNTLHHRGENYFWGVKSQQRYWTNTMKRHYTPTLWLFFPLFQINWEFIHISGNDLGKSKQDIQHWRKLT